jgi:hypothetical protein
MLNLPHAENRAPFDYCEIALVDLMVQMFKGVPVSELKSISLQRARRVYMETKPTPAIESKQS